MAKAKYNLHKIEAAVKAKRPIETDPLQGFDPHSCIVEQVDPMIRPHELHRMIRAAQDARLETLDDYLGRFDDDTLTLTIPEKNFVQVYEMDIRAGTLRRTAEETFIHIGQLIRERQAGKHEG